MYFSFLYILAFYWSIYKLACVIKYMNEPGYGIQGNNYRIQHADKVKWVNKKEKDDIISHYIIIWDNQNINFSTY